MLNGFLLKVSFDFEDVLYFSDSKLGLQDLE